MEERKLNFNRSEDTTIVKLSDDENVIAKKAYDDLRFVIAEFWSRYSKGELDEGFKETLLSLSESHLCDFLKAFNYNSFIERQREERFTEIRSLNKENRELRAQLGGKVTSEDAREKLKLLSESFKKWWNINGFGHSSEETFSGYGSFSTRLSGMVTDSCYSDDKDYSRKDKITYLQEIGFELAIDDREQVVDTESNRALLSKLLKSKFPSCEIIEYRSWAGNKSKAQLRDINIMIRNLDEIVD